MMFNPRVNTIVYRGKSSVVLYTNMIREQAGHGPSFEHSFCRTVIGGLFFGRGVGQTECWVHGSREGFQRAVGVGVGTGTKSLS